MVTVLNTNMTFSSHLFLEPVRPKLITIVTEPKVLRDQQQTIVHCKVGQVKPLADLEIQLLNGTSPVEGKSLVHKINSDGATESAVREFHVIFSRYVWYGLAHLIINGYLLACAVLSDTHIKMNIAHIWQLLQFGNTFAHIYRCFYE